MKRRYGRDLDYTKCDVYDSKRNKLITILDKKIEGTNYRIVLKSNSFNFYVDDMIDKKVEFALNEIKQTLLLFSKIVFEVNGKFPQVTNVVFTKGYEVANQKLIENFEKEKNYVVDEKIGISTKYDEKATLPLLVHSYFIEEADAKMVLDNVEEYIDNLYKANFELKK